ncbi:MULTISPECIES: RteC domain-containing protein [unclassified Carboxylicivirga]|uniref:RteC domain-containing protein n=1 Tax=Carboxylicivirga TaxID=1628153 RepID=UPI003D3279DD
MKNQLNEDCKAILDEYSKEISNLNIEKDDLKTLVDNGIRICKTYLQRLRQKVMDGCIKSEEDEIYFFKYIKPTVLGDLLFYCYLKNTNEHRPICTIYVQEEFLTKKLEKFNHFLKKNYKCYAYYNSEGTQRIDEYYFVRCNLKIEEYSYHPYSIVDSDFATSKDYLFAEFKAHEKIIHFLESELFKLKALKKKRFKSLEEWLTKSPFHWTDSKAAITEIIYAITYSGSINNGNVEIKELAKYFCLLFNIDDLDFYRIYLDIRLRDNQTIYLDKLKKRLNIKIEEDIN